VLQAVLFLTLFGGLNFLALHYHWRFDLSQHRRYSLSPETVSYLQELKRPVRIVVTLNRIRTTPSRSRPTRTCRICSVNTLYHATNHDSEVDRDGRIQVDYLDVYKNRREADALGSTNPT